MEPLLTTLHPWHEAHGARFTTFGGWEMPVSYPSGTVAEHRLTRRSAGLFDIDHMGQFRVSGNDAADFLDSVVSSSISTLPVGSSRYGLLCREDGGIIDDVFVYRETNSFLVVVNASRREIDLAWLKTRAETYSVSIEDMSSETYMVALQGPRAVSLASLAFATDLEPLARFGITAIAWEGITISAGRTGYTGEDGVELFFPDGAAEAIWTQILHAGAVHEIEVGPVGLAARDTLRLEAGYPLYGHELSEGTSPAEARLLWACDFGGAPWVGRDAVLARKSAPVDGVLVRFAVDGRGVARAGYPVMDASGETVGRVVSGSKGPTVDRFIGNAYVSPPAAKGTNLSVVIRGERVPIVRHKGPFYRCGYKTVAAAPDLLARTSEYKARHIGPRPSAQREMAAVVGVKSVEDLIDRVIPPGIRLDAPLELPGAMTEDGFLVHMRALAARNQTFRSLIGMGYHDAIMPAVIRRAIFENPSWYTQYTPYQAEISQGRLEALLNFETMVTELTGMEIANASMLDEATAVGEAMALAFRARKRSSRATRFLVDTGVHPQTVAHLRLRAEPWGISISQEKVTTSTIDETVFGVLVQYPDTAGHIGDFREVADRTHQAGAILAVATDPLALTILQPPAEWGADIAAGTTQRFGVPLGYGGPHAAFFATQLKFQRLLPGRIVGVSVDRAGHPAARLALQTREQHIRREKATSNICTAQVLLAVLASMYAVYHGPEGLTRIAHRIHLLAELLRAALKKRKIDTHDGPVFDTVTFGATPTEASAIRKRAERARFNLQYRGDGSITIALDERSTVDEVAELVSIVTDTDETNAAICEEISTAAGAANLRFPPALERSGSFMTQRVFHDHRSETALLRYITSLQERDLSLANAMIPLGSCTMKLNPAAAMEPLSWPELASIHPFAPHQQTAGYGELMDNLRRSLAAITGFPGCTLQPNSGAQGEFTGLMVIRSYHRERGDTERTICLVPDSAHGTNPASAVMAGMEVVVVGSTSEGDIDLADLREKAERHAERLSAFMVTYPSTHGVFEASVHEAAEIVHRFGGQVYMDGANMNAQIGLTSPAQIGADVCHLNLHKTFAIPHGGGGPGVGPVLVAEHLVPFLPGDVKNPGKTGVVVGAPAGSALVLPISYGYILMMGAEGLTRASETAILNANYLAARISPYFPIAFTGNDGFVAHECVLDFRHVEKETGVTVEDVAKRLIDYGFHAPTMSWPLHGSLMVEPTESENRAELDRFVDAMTAIHEEIEEIRTGRVAVDASPLRNAPHTLSDITGEWDREYTREKAVFPAHWLRERKFWPAVGRIDNVAGDRNLVCSCAPIEAYRTGNPDEQ